MCQKSFLILIFLISLISEITSIFINKQPNDGPSKQEISSDAIMPGKNWITKLYESMGAEVPVYGLPFISGNRQIRAIRRYIRRKKETLPKVWDRWGKWSPCSVSCGAGKVTRWRHCIAGGCARGEKEAQIKTCILPECWNAYFFYFLYVNNTQPENLLLLLGYYCATTYTKSDVVVVVTKTLYVVYIRI